MRRRSVLAATSLIAAMVQPIANAYIDFPRMRICDGTWYGSGRLEATTAVVFHNGGVI